MNSISDKKIETRHGTGKESLGQVFLKQADRNGDLIFQIDADTEKKETFRQIKQRSVPVAVELKKLGVVEGDLILLCCNNNSDNIIPALAAWYLGAIVTSVYPKQILSEIKHCLSIIEPKVLFVIEESVDLMEEALRTLNTPPTIVVIGSSNKYRTMADMERTVLNAEEEFKPAELSSNQTAMVLFSSGTTSTPKGLCLSHYSVLYASYGLAEQYGHKMDIVFHSSSLQWVSAVLLTGWCISAAKTKVIGSNLAMERFLELVEKFKITYALLLTLHASKITHLDQNVLDKYDTSSLQSLRVGGCLVSPKDMMKLRDILRHTKVTQGYGSTESLTVTAFDLNRQKAYEEKINSCGISVPDVQLKFLDVDTGKPVGPYQQGEIRIKSPYATTGYYRLNKTDLFDDEGFLRQGDLGYYDDDGYVYVTDRLNEMFKYKVYQISPTIVEQVLLEHPSVKEAVVFGLPHPDDVFQPAACVVTKNDVDLVELTKFVNTRMPDYRRIRGGIRVVNELPKTPSGKIQRRKVRDLFLKAIG